MKKISIMKKNNGFTGVDLTVSIIIVLLFISLITTLFYNLYTTSIANKRMNNANSYIINIFEEIDKISYEDTTIDNVLNIINNIEPINISSKEKNSSTILTTPYKVEVSIKNYNEIEGNENKKDLIKIVSIDVKYNFLKKEEKLTSEKLKKKEVAFSDSLGIIPKITAGMTPVKYVYGSDGIGYWQATTIYDSEWFDYSKNKWANIMMNDGISIDSNGKITNVGSMFVYIPRYAYMIKSQNYNTNISGEIPIKFLNTNNTCKDNSNTDIRKYVNSSIAQQGINSTTYYIQHSGFTFGTQELEGIWVAKFEASNSGETAVQIKPGVVSWTNITLNSIITNSKNATYGVSNKTFDTHLIKNIEWGAATYLAQSSYGRNGTEITSNNDSNYYTGGGIGDSYILNTNQSTTDNIYGIYDLNGGTQEITASYINNSYISSLSSNLITEDDKYKDIYDIGNSDSSLENYNKNNLKYGDVLYETSVLGNNTAWNNDNSSYPYDNNPFFLRGGSAIMNSNSGIFAYSFSNGTSSSNSFRTVIVI